jgi:hypothetical protein
MPVDFRQFSQAAPRGVICSRCGDAHMSRRHQYKYLHLRNVGMWLQDAPSGGSKKGPACFTRGISGPVAVG